MSLLVHIKTLACLLLTTFCFSFIIPPSFSAIFQYKDIVPTLEPSPIATATTSSQKGIILGALSGLSEREREIIIMRYGLSGTKKLTLDEIGSKYKITRCVKLSLETCFVCL